ncbi:(5-formylfuran-3-yl)methyl phosphate synthase [Rhodopseudomonas sp. B29]|uniref:(5-formylfuran-3-yl)methyl phosphate synthase n=1 Tax=Rhodopseudomonas sp. B29 TaxID=95607 RepID=UPI000A07683B|nr:(5-formylfuran-3-yl)methyl phosphate synthase [Rhodopseudomonas sp. B29]
MPLAPVRLVNRKLLVSVFNAQEAREAVLGGGRIIDSEDPKSALGNISPRHIMDISDAVLDFRRDLEVQLSTNIGEDQLLFRRSQTGQAIEKSRYEIAGKAAQAALGVALSMGTRVHPVSFVKVGVDGMEVDKIGQVLNEVVDTLRRTEALSHCQVMSVLFAQDLQMWQERRRNEGVRKVLVELREFNPSSDRDPDAFDVGPYAVGTLRDPQTGQVLFSDASQVSLSTLIQRGVLPQGSDSTFVRANELFEHRKYFPQIAKGAARTTKAVIKAMVDVTAESGANAIMIDTSILSKVTNICLVDTRGDEMVDINSLVVRDNLQQRGILSLDELRFFVDYCHYRGVAANVAGSIESYQAQQLWQLIPELDQASTRGSASGVDIDPSNTRPAGQDTRQHRVIKRALVRGLAPPEHGGVLNFPASLQGVPGAIERVRELIARQREYRQSARLPELQAFWVDSAGRPSPIDQK